MRLWPTEKALRNWIKYHWKPNGELELHLGSKGFFTAVFINLKYLKEVHTSMHQQDCTCSHGRKIYPQKKRPSKRYRFG
jgi:hypothetical protein